MDSEVLISLIFAPASIVSSICFGFIPATRKAKLEKLEMKIQRLLWNMKLYHEIEDELLNRLVSTGANKLNTQQDVRNKVYQDNGDTF
jgi:hypothetical protein